MPLTLTVLRCPDSVPPETRTVAGGEFTVGRGPGVDWVLPDPQRLLSKHHFAVAYRGGSWQIADTSTNGTTLNHDPSPLGQAELRVLRDGDRLTLGSYEIEIRVTDETSSLSGISRPPPGFSARPPARGDSPFTDPFAPDPLAPPPPARQAFDEASQSGFGLAPAAQLPSDFDPLASGTGFSGPAFSGPTRSDHSPVLEDAFRPPAPVGHTPLHTGGALPGDDLLPDDWNADLLEGINPPSAAPPASTPVTPPAAQPVVPPPRVEPVAQPVLPPVALRATRPVDVDPFAEEDVPSPVPRGAPPDAVRSASPFESASPFDDPAPAVVPRPVAVPPAPAPTAPVPAGDGALLAAFLQGVGMTDVQPGDPAAMMRSLGQAFRSLVEGLRAVLIARASIKSEFRIEQTMIRAHGNNPLKFSAGDDDALAALLGTGRRTDMTAAAAVADALKDIRLHELASMAAMQRAVRAVLDGLDPAKLRAQADQGGGMSLLPVQKKARAWDAFETSHAHIIQALADDFDSIFGKAFARAYEHALDEVAARER